MCRHKPRPKNSISCYHIARTMLCAQDNRVSRNGATIPVITFSEPALSDVTRDKHLMGGIILTFLNDL